LRVRWLAVFACLLGAFALGMTACGDDDDDGGGGGGGAEGGGGGTVNVYSSLPLQGASRPQTTAMVDGIKLALEQNGGKAGETTVKYTSLDDSTAQAGTWTPEATGANARKVAGDDAAVAYIGEFNSGASAVSIPILNEVPIAQVSPANTAVGLTSDEPGADKGEPDKYYPTGERHYLRIVPKDTIQGAALATIMKQDGCKTVYILNDKEVYGAGLSRNIESSAKEQGLEVAGNDGIDPKAPNFRSQASTIADAGADCFVFSGITANGAVQLYKDVSEAVPDAKLYGPDGVAESGFSDPKEGGIPADVAGKVKVTVATLSPDEYPPEGQKFFDDFSAKYGEDNPDPYAIYGYEAMRLVLDTCEELGPDCSDRQKMIDALFQTKGRESVLGTYDIDENGDTTLTDYGVYTIKGGELQFEETVQAEAG
jgi:branched-chain amino acid transport system substrate-binding protein